MKGKSLGFIAGLLWIVLVFGGMNVAAQSEVDYWPTDGWRTSAPEEQGMDSQRLDDMLAYIEAEGLGLHSLLVIRHGTIVSETYFGDNTPDMQHELYSVTKSFTSTLVGIAIDEGYIDSVEQPVLDFFPDYVFTDLDPRKAAMTLEDVLTMQTGLSWRENMVGRMMSQPDPAQYLLYQTMVYRPGTHINYCTGCSHLLSVIVQRTTGSDTRQFAEEKLFKPLGIDDFVWLTDNQGLVTGGYGLRLTPRDMAKLGYLFLHDGLWDGQQVVSAEWVEAATQKQADNPYDSFITAYGYQWWVFPSVKAYSALGMDGQTIFVIPDQDMLVVTTASMDGHNAIFALIKDYIIPAVQDTAGD